MNFFSFWRVNCGHVIGSASYHAPTSDAYSSNKFRWNLPLWVNVSALSILINIPAAFLVNIPKVPNQSLVQRVVARHDEGKIIHS